MNDQVEIGAAIPRRRRPFFAALGRLVLRAGGWHLAIKLPDTPKLVVIAAPHTSNWDFVFGLAAILALDLDLRWFGKHTIFKGPWGALFRALGGIPIDRSAAGGVVAQTARAFADSPQLVVGLAPEGTRSRVSHWKRGFYHLARSAQVPVAAAYIDYRRKLIGCELLFRPTGDWDADMAPVFDFYRGITAKKPENVDYG